jgi:hypothetical protein
MALALRFSHDEIPGLVERYVAADETRSVGDRELEPIAPRVRSRAFLTRPELHKVARWKATRSAGRILRNDPAYVEEVTRVALSTESERFRIEVLTVLDGVGWPMASVILHWFHADRYPILDFRALASVGAPPTQRYDFTFWNEYTTFCRGGAEAAGISMRDFDRALWQHSYEENRSVAEQS